MTDRVELWIFYIIPVLITYTGIFTGFYMSSEYRGLYMPNWKVPPVALVICAGFGIAPFLNIITAIVVWMYISSKEYYD